MLSQSGSRTTSNRVTTAASAAILSPWSRVPDRGVHLVLELSEVLPEHLHEPRRLGIVRRRVAPGAARQKHVLRYARDLQRDFDSEHGVGRGGDAVELPGERGAHHGARETEPDPLAHAVGSAGPPGVHEPALHAVGGDLLAQERRVDVGLKRQEGGAEAGGERRLRLGHAALRARDLRGVPRQEVVHRLRRREAMYHFLSGYTAKVAGT